MRRVLWGKVRVAAGEWAGEEELAAVWVGIEAIKPVQARVGIAFVLIAAQKRRMRWALPVLRSGALNAIVSWSENNSEL